jgi:hypothetical protein
MHDPDDPLEFDDGGEEADPEIWDEFQWEEFMKESDKRTDKYIELSEKYRDDPDAEKLIAKEMGWDWLVEALEAEERGELPQTNSEEEPDADDEEGEEWKRATQYESLDLDDVDQLPIYQKAFQYGCDALRLAEGLHAGSEVRRQINTFVEGATVPAAKIRGGFTMGFDLDFLGGNIANCKRGLAAANRGLAALQQLRDAGIVDADVFQEFYRRAKEIRDELALYIVELRERFQRGLG